jgi:hypothetical protein
MRHTPKTKSKWPVKYVVRVRDVANDTRTEREWTFLDEAEADALLERASVNGFFAYINKVADWKQLERV